jgi:hypothetical protein
MRVKAIRLGYYNHKRRREGDIFDLLNEKHFSKHWMEKFSGKSKGSKKVQEPELEEGEEPAGAEGDQDVI